jgi:DNA repair protein RadC
MNLAPSEQDMVLTRKIVEGGKMLDLPVLDHLILTKEYYLLVW